VFSNMSKYVSVSLCRIQIADYFSTLLNVILYLSHSSSFVLNNLYVQVFEIVHLWAKAKPTDFSFFFSHIFYYMHIIPLWFLWGDYRYYIIFQSAPHSIFRDRIICFLQLNTAYICMLSPCSLFCYLLDYK
jgi:hypothetical protein